jgi:hypothetical protein
LANSFEDAPSVFIELARYISLPKDMPLDLEEHVQLPTYIQTLREYFYKGSENYIIELWGNIKWPIGLKHLAQQLVANEADSIITIDIIKARAFTEFCYKTASYFFGYHYLARDVGKGLLDVPAGVIRVICHPGDAIRGAGRLFTRNGWANIGKSAWNRPWRFVTGVVPSIVAGGALIHALKAATTAAQAANTTAQAATTTFKAVNPALHTAIPTFKAINPALHTAIPPLQAINPTLSTINTSVFAGSINTIIDMTQTSVRSDIEKLSTLHSNVENSGSTNNLMKVEDNLWVLFLPNRDQAKTPMDFYKMLSELQQELEQCTHSCKAICLTDASQTAFFPHHDSFHLGLVNPQLQIQMHYRK